MFLSFPGFDGLGIDQKRDDSFFDHERDEPYIFHFPDGNAGIARLIVRQLVCKWEPFTRLGVRGVRYPGGLMDSVVLDFPVSPVNLRTGRHCRLCCLSFRLC